MVFALYSLFALVFTISKVALLYSSPFFLIGSRMSFAGLLMLAYLLYRNPAELKMKMSSLRLILALAFFNIYLTNVCEYWGLQYLTSFKTCFIYSLSPFVSALLSYFVWKERLSQKKWLGLVVGFAGFLPILLSMGQGESLSGQFGGLSFAEIAVTIAAVSSVWGWILLGKLTRDEEKSPLFANGYSMLFGGIMAFTHSAFFESWNPLPVTEFVPFVETTLALMVISNLLAYNLYGHLLKTYSATFLSFAGFTTPLFTALFGYFFLGEVVGVSFFISGSIVFSGLFLFHQEELKLGIRREPTPV